MGLFRGHFRQFGSYSSLSSPCCLLGCGCFSYLDQLSGVRLQSDIVVHPTHGRRKWTPTRSGSRRLLLLRASKHVIDVARRIVIVCAFSSQSRYRVVGVGRRGVHDSLDEKVCLGASKMFVDCFMERCVLEQILHCHCFMILV